ncbi:outer membrane protein assembly factor BamB family protein [Haloarcula laminariae]|uniref:outer membrane protein assembly factor BamB family protein n=1 Tax=Haloarcula laminariae TaxID=2961577 RepID=UPI00240772D7|nr:PQQ-binding-like beta-propeller repeat protein [Halomicroarcula sp. FL173]
MSGPADSFDENTDALSDVRPVNLGDYLHEYTGVLAETDERVRILTLTPELADVDTAVDTFAQVSDRWYNASANANILTIRERGTDPRPWIAIPNLSPNADTLATIQPELSPDAIETVISETAEALRTVSLYNAVHGHLSPDDIYIQNADSETDKVTVEVGGFGLEAAIQAAVGEFEPTAYTAPELLDGSNQPTEETDVYGLAAISYFALIGSPPVEGANLDQTIQDGPANHPSAYDDKIPAGLDDAVIQALAANPADRYESPYAFHRAFVSAFDPDLFPEEQTEEYTDDTQAQTTSTDTSSDSGSASEPQRSDEQVDATPSSEDDSGRSLTRRALLGITGLGGVSTVAAGVFFSGGRNEGWFPNAIEYLFDRVQWVDPAFTSSPAVVDETVYVGSGRSIRALDATDGSEQWTFETEAREITSPSVVDATVYSADTDGRLYALDAADGSEQWSVNTGDVVNSQVAVADNSVYVLSDDADGNGSIYALSVEGGTEQWTSGSFASLQSSAAVAYGTVYVGDTEGTIYAVSAADGSQQWTVETTAPVISSPAVANGTVYVGDRGGMVYALSATNGSQRWTSDTGGRGVSSIAVGNDTIYIGGTNGTLSALSAEDGSEQWTFSTGGYDVSIALTSDIVYVGGGDTLYALSVADGTERWSQTCDPGESSPVLDGDSIYVGGYQLYALETDRQTAATWPMVQADQRNSGHFSDGDTPTPLVPSIAVVPVDPTVGESVTFSAADSIVGENLSVTAHEWAFGESDQYKDGRESITRSFSETGEYRVRLRITDSEDRTATTATTVTVQRDIGSSPTFQYDAANTGYAPTESGPTVGVTEQWTYQTNGEVTSSPAIVDGTVYVGSEDGYLYALSAMDGTEHWSFRTGDAIRSSPTVVDETMYLGSDDGTVYAVSTADGTENWAFQTEDAVPSSPAVVDNTVYVGSVDNNIYALDASSGSEQWRYDTGGSIPFEVAVVDGVVYAGGGANGAGTVYALSAADGTEQWNRQLGDIYSPVSVADGTVYVGIFETVYALEAATGSVEWTQGLGNVVRSSIAVSDTGVYVGSFDTNVYALNPATGAEQWSYETGDQVLSSPSVVDGTVYFGSSDSNIYALSEADGAEQWTAQTGDSVQSSPAVVDGTVYVGSDDNNVYVLSEQ